MTDHGSISSDGKDGIGFYDKETYTDKTTFESRNGRDRVQRGSQVPGGDPGYKDDLLASHTENCQKGGGEDCIIKSLDGKYERIETGKTKIINVDDILDPTLRHGNLGGFPET